MVLSAVRVIVIGLLSGLLLPMLQGHALVLASSPAVDSAQTAQTTASGTTRDNAPARAAPNILLLMAEDMSARVGRFGDPVADTPNLDALAQQGVMYPNTFTTAGVCAPSRAAHILGMHQIATGSQHMRSSGGPNGGYLSVPPPYAKAYPELLRRAGYYTYTDTKLDYQFSGPFWRSGPFTIWDDTGRDTSWRNRKPSQPFFGFTNFAVTHESGIFRPLGHWPHSIIHLVMQVLRAVQSPDVELAQSTDPAAIIVPPYYPDTPTVRADMARHYDNIAIMDRQVGALLKQLESDGLADSTIVIWTTDHGDGLPRGKRELYDSGIKVPMIIRWPEAYRPQGVAPGSVDLRMVSFVDIAPTVLRLAGVKVPAHMHGRDFLSGERRRYVFASRDRIDEIPDRQRAVSDERFKYIRSWHPHLAGGHPLRFRDNIDMVREMRALYEDGRLNARQRLWFEPVGEERLFDLQKDPFELNNVLEQPQYQLDADRMRLALEAWLDSIEDWSDRPESSMAQDFQPEGKTPVTAPPVAQLDEGRLQLSASESASVGYRINNGAWQLYSRPVPVSPGTTVEAKAVRYGWEESNVVTVVVPAT
jgi:arylsulfatase A-like enzyme